MRALLCHIRKLCANFVCQAKMKRHVWRFHESFSVHFMGVLMPQLDCDDCDRTYVIV